MADSKDKAKDSKVTDVAEPEKTAAPTDTKPTTAAHHSLLTEDAPKADNPSQITEETKEPSTSVTPKVKIEPISKPEDLKPDEEKKPEEAASKTEDSSEDDIDDESGERNKLKDADQDEQQLIDKKAAERQANYDKITLAKTYYLPINQVVRRRSKRVAIAGAVLIILLGLAWLDIALDAGLITIPGVEAPTHFFSK